MLVVFCGGIGAGKDTLADFVQKNVQVQNHSPWHRLSFAAELKKITADLLSIPVQWLDSREMKARKVALSAEKTIGQCLQFIGTEIGRAINPNIWIEKLCDTIVCHGVHNGIITDCRFENEAETLLDYFPDATILFHLNRKAVTSQESRDAGHASEDQDWIIKFDGYRWVIPIDNANQTLEETQQCVLQHIYDFRKEME